MVRGFCWHHVGTFQNKFKKQPYRINLKLKHIHDFRHGEVAKVLFANWLACYSRMWGQIEIQRPLASAGRITQAHAPLAERRYTARGNNPVGAEALKIPEILQKKLPLKNASCFTEVPPEFHQKHWVFLGINDMQTLQSGPLPRPYKWLKNQWVVGKWGLSRTPKSAGVTLLTSYNWQGGPPCWDLLLTTLAQAPNVNRTAKT